MHPLECYKFSTANSMISVLCPVCNIEICVENSDDPNTVLAPHIDRCLGSKKRSSSDKINKVIGSKEYKSDEEFFGALSSDDDSTYRKRRKLRKKSSTVTNKTTKVRGRPTKKQPQVSSEAQTNKRISTKYGDVSINNDENADDICECNYSDDHNEVTYDSDSDSDDEMGHIRVKVSNVEDDWEDNAYLGRLELLQASLTNHDRDANKAPDLPTSSTAAIMPGTVSTLKYVTTEFNTEVYSESWASLYHYQREGCRWMMELYKNGVGGILADEMGLGKTAQLCIHFGSLARQEAVTSGSGAGSAHRQQSHSGKSGDDHLKLVPKAQAKPIFLVVCPATVLQHWLKEFHKWSPEMRVVILHSVSTTGNELRKMKDEFQMKYVIRTVQRLRSTRQGVVILMTFEGLRLHRALLCGIEWTAVCFDEGHKIRNPDTEITKIAKTLPCYHRLVLSGTPIQNTLVELWSLFDFIYPGRLGTLVMFQTEFCDPIRQGGYAGASVLKTEIATKTASLLQRIVKPYLLRRRKDQLGLLASQQAPRTQTPTLEEKEAENNQDAAIPLNNISSSNGISNSRFFLPEKTEHVIFCQLTKRQKHLYLRVLDSPEVQAVIASRMIPFRALSALRKLCNHPAMLTDDDYNQLLLQKYKHKYQSRYYKHSHTEFKADSFQYAKNSSSKSKKTLHKATDGAAASGPHFNEAAVNWTDSGKLIVLSKILPVWRQQGHKVLLFSQTQSLLNILEILFKQWNLNNDPSSSSSGGGGYSHSNKWKKFKYLRLDGSTPVYKRESIISRFNTDPSVFIILLTTKTGGVGISLTAASKVILLDPDWNPQTDLQARERAWRLGQTRPVTVYRLIARGTIEEKIYERQVFKIMLSNRILLNPAQKAIFSKSLIRELFSYTAGSADAETSTPHASSSRSSGRAVQGSGLHKRRQDSSSEQRDRSLPLAGYVDMTTSAASVVAAKECENVSNDSRLLSRITDSDKGGSAKSRSDCSALEEGEEANEVDISSDGDSADSLSEYDDQDDDLNVQLMTLLDQSPAAEGLCRPTATDDICGYDDEQLDNMTVDNMSSAWNLGVSVAGSASEAATDGGGCNDDFQVTATDMFSSGSIVALPASDARPTRGRYGQRVKYLDEADYDDCDDISLLPFDTPLHDIDAFDVDAALDGASGTSVFDAAAFVAKPEQSVVTSSSARSMSSHRDRMSDRRTVAPAFASRNPAFSSQSTLSAAKTLKRTSSNSGSVQGASEPNSAGLVTAVNGMKASSAASAALSDDKELLKLLLSDHSISSVFDHTYFEAPRSAADKQAVQTLAEQRVNKAAQSVFASSAVYIAPSAFNQSAALSTTSTDATIGGNHSSTDLLASIRRRREVDAASGANLDKCSSGAYRGVSLADVSSQPPPMRHNSIHNPVSRDSGAEGGSSGADQSSSVKGQITHRIQQLFRSHGHKLKIDFILSKFSDLGDQYAPLFKQSLRGLAKLNPDDGHWHIMSNSDALLT